MKNTPLPSLLITCALLFGCSDDAKEEAKENSAVWETYASGSYEYDILELCNCPNPRGFHTIIIDGEIFSTTAIGPNLSNTNSGNAIATIEQLFDIATQHGVTATYNAQYGYPELIEITPEDTDSNSSEGVTIRKDPTAGFETKNFSLI